MGREKGAYRIRRFVDTIRNRWRRSAPVVVVAAAVVVVAVGRPG